MKVGFIGAGRMGCPMAGRLVETGHQVRVLGRTAGARSELTQLGATAVAEAVQAAEKADVVIVCVSPTNRSRNSFGWSGRAASAPTSPMPRT